jgi:arginine/serine-rich splicing factor 4/5/6
MRAEFARGDGRIKRKEDDRRKDILPNETLFVVNFSEETTKREDLEMLFSPFGELVRIDMKKNYAFVQFTNVEDSIKAKDATNGGKLDQSVITVEFVAAKRRDRDDYRDRGGGDRGGYRGRRDDNRGGYRGRRDDRDRDDRRYGDDRRRSPPRGRRDRSRSRSPLPYRGGYRSRSRSPPMRRGDRDDNRGGGGRYNDSSRDGGRDNRGYR